MYIKVKVTPDSKNDLIEVKNADTYRVFVRASAERGAANKSMLALVAKHLDIPVGQLHIIKGHTTPNKILEVQKK